MADDISGGESEETCGAAVPTGDEAFEGDADNGVVGRLDDGGKARLLGRGAAAADELADLAAGSAEGAKGGVGGRGTPGEEKLDDTHEVVVDRDRDSYAADEPGGCSGGPAGEVGVR